MNLSLDIFEMSKLLNSLQYAKMREAGRPVKLRSVTDDDIIGKIGGAMCDSESFYGVG